jgi:diguanylate cyclase (GGDEF)-like protein
MLLPRFRETRTFFGLCAAGSLLAIAFAWMGRTRQLRTRAAELEALVAQRTQQLQDANQRLESLAKVDELTRVANRRCFNAQLEVEWRRMRRNAEPLAVVLVDVDDFKAFNDHYGHLRGDECLIEVAEALQGAVGRPADLVARYGGEEFVLLLPETPEKGCRYVAERARAAVENLGINHERSRTGGIVTISLGMAVVVPADRMSPQALIHAADEALYRAKRAGRNRAEVATLG